MRVVATQYIKGETKAVCDRCGFVYFLSDLRREWSGLMVCEHDYDPLPDTMRPPVVYPEGLPAPDSRPEPPDTFIQSQVKPSDL